MGWIDNLSRRIGERKVKSMIEKEHQETPMPDIKKDLDDLEELRLQLIKKDEELEKTRLEWDRTFDSIIDNIVLIDRDMCITKANNSFHDCMEREVGHIEYLGMRWSDFRSISGIPSDVCPVERCFETGVHQEATIPIRGKIVAVTVNPIYINTTMGKEILGVVRVSRDITSVEKIKTTLERRSTIYHAISEMSKILVNHRNWSSAVNLILGDLGRAIGASRVYIFKNEIRGDCICSIRQSVFHNKQRDYCDSGDLTDCINYDLLPEWRSKMEHGLSVEGSIIDCDLCPNKHACKCSDEVLVCAVPVFVDGSWWGFIGFDYQNGTRIWKDEDATLLRIAADILGGVIYHRSRYFDALNALNGLEDCVDELVHEREL